MKTSKENNNSFGRKLGANNLTNQNGNLNSTLNLGNSSAVFDHKTFVKIFYGDSKVILLNSLCSCLHMLNYLKEQLNLNKDDLIDLIDFEGNLKEIPNMNNREYAIQYLSPTGSYAVLKIELDSNTNEKRYSPMINENKLTPNMTKTLTNLNTGKTLNAKDKAKLNRDSRLKSQQLQQQQSQQQLLQNPSTNSISNLQSNNSATNNTNNNNNSQTNTSNLSNQGHLTNRKSSKQLIK